VGTYPSIGFDVVNPANATPPSVGSGIRVVCIRAKILFFVKKRKL
jgi:hypothetical protein